MGHLPTPDETRELVRPLDALDRKVLAASSTFCGCRHADAVGARRSHA